LVLSLDALFGLPRKKAAGTSHRDALHGNLIFGDQNAVDENVSSYYMSHHKVPKVACVTKILAIMTSIFVQICSSFLAGDSLRSSKRYHALDETAVFGGMSSHFFH